MTFLPFTLRIDPLTSPVLFTVRGTLAAPDLENGRQTHNLAAGSDQGVAAARSLGDLSHAVFVPVEPSGKGAGELLILDTWVSAAGIGMFFSDPQVQQGAGMLFTDRETVIWQASPGLPRIALPAPAGRNDRWAGIVRGPVASREAAEKIVTESVRKRLSPARAKGLISREWFFRWTPPGEKPSLEAIGLDLWFDGDGMQEIYADPAEMAGLAGLFTGMPATSVWKKPAGAWIEW